LIFENHGWVRIARMTKPEMCVNVTTVITYLLPGSPTTNAGVLGPETLGGALLLTVFITFASWPEATALAFALSWTTGGCPRLTNGLFVGRRDNFSRKMQPFAEVFNTLRSESVVIILPRELGLDEPLGRQTLKGLDNFEVRNIEIFMFGEVVVLFGNQNTLLEEIFVDDAAILF